MKRYNTEAIVLKNINYSDSHKIYTLLSRDAGKITAIARGVRKISSKRGGNLDSINKVVVSITEDSKGFKSIQEVKPLETYINIKNDFNCTIQAIYVIDMVRSLLESEHENLEVYLLLDQTLDLLNKNPEFAGVIVNKFEITLSKILGFEMSLDKCSSCRRVYDETWNRTVFSYAHGGLLCDRCNPVGVSVENNLVKFLMLINKPIVNLSSTLVGFTVDSFSKADVLLKNYIEYAVWDNIRYSKSVKLLFDSQKM